MPTPVGVVAVEGAAALLDGGGGVPSGGTGHPGVAAWVADNSGDVGVYWDMTDATDDASVATMDDGRGNLDGTHQAAVGLGAINGEGAADYSGASGSFSFASDDPILDTIVGFFCVVEFDNTASAFETVLARDSNLDRNWQLRRDTAGRLSMLRVGAGNPTITGTTVLAANTRHTVGVAYDGVENETHLYVDGIIEATITGNLVEAGGSTFSVGCMLYPTGNSDFEMDGQVASIVGLTAFDALHIPSLHAAWVNAYPLPELAWTYDFRDDPDGAQPGTLTTIFGSSAGEIVDGEFRCLNDFFFTAVESSIGAPSAASPQYIAIMARFIDPDGDLTLRWGGDPDLATDRNGHVYRQNGTYDQEHDGGSGGAGGSWSTPPEGVPFVVAVQVDTTTGAWTRYVNGVEDGTGTITNLADGLVGGWAQQHNNRTAVLAWYYGDPPA